MNGGAPPGAAAANPFATSIIVAGTGSAAYSARSAGAAFAGMPRPSGSAVFDVTTRAKRSGTSATTRSPTSPPQSWQTSVMPRRSSASTNARSHATWRA